MGLRTVIGGIGAAVGFAIGGPGGAQLGWALGSVAGNIVDPVVTKGPALGDLAVQTSSEGGPIPIVFNMSPPIAGNVIATSNPIIKKQKSGGKKGKVESEVVYRTYAIGVCEGPISGFIRVWRNNKLVFDGSYQGLLSDEENQDFLDNTEIYLGTYDQDASPALEAIFGVGTTASHRGIAYIVRVNEDVNDMQGACAQWQFQVGPAEVVEVPGVKLDNHTASIHAVYNGFNGQNVLCYFALDTDDGRFRIGATGSESLYAYLTLDINLDGVETHRPNVSRGIVFEDEWYVGTIPEDGIDLSLFEVQITWSGDLPTSYTGYGLGPDEEPGTWQDMTSDILFKYEKGWVGSPNSLSGSFTLKIRSKATEEVLDFGTMSLSLSTEIG